MTTFNKKIPTRTTSTLLTGALLCMIGASGCEPPQEVNSKVSLVDRTTHALSLGSILAINGTYGAGCTNKTGSWSAAVGGFSGIDNAALSVLKNDTGCVLSATEVRIGDAMSSAIYAMSSPMELGASYQSSGAAFTSGMGNPTAFYGNFRITPDLLFATDFTVQMVYSEDPSLTSSMKNATYAVQSASATAGAVSPPDYTLDASALTIQVDVNKVVQSAAGTVDLTDGAVTGQKYVIDLDTLATTPTYAEVDSVFTGGTQTNITGANPSIPASAFSLGSLDLSSANKRSVVVANIQNGTRSYQIFRVTFNSP